MKIAVCIFVVLISAAGSIIAQPFPQDLGYSRYTDVLLDAGYLWNVNSISHPLSCFPADDSIANTAPTGAYKWMYEYLQNYSQMRRSLQNNSDITLNALFLPGIGLAAETGVSAGYHKLAVQPFGWFEAFFHRHWYARLYIRASNESASLSHYTGIPRDISRAGFNTGEVDQSLIGYKNDWLNVDYGRSREIWGAGSQGSLIFSGQAPAYERLMLQFTYKRFSYRYFYGFLETAASEDGDIQRYMVGRLLEYNNRKNLVLGISETTVFAGLNRPIDMAFLNPLGFHFDIDLNDRGNTIANNDNAIWGIYCDWLPASSLRLNGSIAVDEFQIDSRNLAEGGAGGMAYFGRISWTPRLESLGFTLFAQGVRLDTYFGQHSSGWANLVSRDDFLGYPIGNDAYKISLGSRIILPFKTALEAEIGRFRWGDNSLWQNPYSPYDEYIVSDFPSGQVKTNDFMEIQIDSHPLKNMIVNVSSHIDLNTSGENSALEKYSLSLIYIFPSALKL